MALHAVAITKRTLYHGVQEEFDNIYYYDGPTFQLGDANYERLVKAVAEAERLVHGDEVEFISGRIWSSGGTIVENITLGLYDLDGFGRVTAGTFVHAEAAVMVEWECSRPNSLGRKVYLRKFLRPQKLAGLQSGSEGRGKAALPAGAITPFKTYADTVQLPGIVGDPTWNLCSPTVRLPRAEGNGVVDPQVRTREFRRN